MAVLAAPAAGGRMVQGVGRALVITVNAYWFYGLIEALLAVLAVAVVVWLKLRQVGARLAARDRRDRSVRAWVGETRAKVEAAVGKPDNTNPVALTETRACLAWLRAIDQSAASDAFETPAWQRLYAEFSGVVSQWKKELEKAVETAKQQAEQVAVVGDDDLPPVAGDEAPDDTGADYQALTDLLDTQRAKISDLLEYRDQAHSTMERFRQVRATNQKLIAYLAKTKEEGQHAKVLEVVIARLEENGEKLQQSLAELERENARLDLQTKDLQRVVDELNAESARAKSRSERLRFGQTELLDKLAQQKAEAEKYKAGHDAMIAKYELLKKEYLHLFQGAATTRRRRV